MKTNNNILKKIKLTEDTYTNVLIMLPYLNDIDKAKIFGIVFGMIISEDIDQLKEE